jgi:oligopeptide/dipeptide ABC transporter ATP-binding protein
LNTKENIKTQSEGQDSKSSKRKNNILFGKKKKALETRQQRKDRAESWQGPLLELNNLSLGFETEEGFFLAVRNLSFSINTGETLAVVGESGCGKSVTAHAITRLIPSPPGKVTEGEILLEGWNLRELKEFEMRGVRGQDISMIFQEPMTSLNPVFPIGKQIADVIMQHEDLDKKEAMLKAETLLEKVKIPDPAKRINDYPHQLSGGMRQRVMIAMALASPKPKLMIADEPTTALDVTVQAQILTLLQELKESIGMSILLITHDMGVVAQTADRVVVMYAGRKVEEARAEDLFADPNHPYTIGLLKSLPMKTLEIGANRIPSIPGSVPVLKNIGEGCPFANRCDQVMDICKSSFPQEITLRTGNNHQVACHAVAKQPQGSNTKGTKV